ncbi:MAG: aspartate/glutamate racemase family protein, partial [Pseudomonadota bacterium]
MLNTRFPRLVGDIGNPDSFNYPVIYQTIASATPATVVTDQPIADVVREDIIHSAEKLQQQGVSIITTSCGFLSPLQQSLANAASVPVITSSLVLLPLLNNCFGSQHTGVLTFDAQKLSTAHLKQQQPQAVEGLRGHDSLRVTIENDLDTLNHAEAESQVCDAASRLMQQSPTLRAIILECTNLSPYKHTLRAQFPVAVFDIVDA